MSDFHFWNLLAKKLSGEASAEELDQLEKMIRENPDWAYQADHIQGLWTIKKEQDVLESHFAFENHIQKIKEAGLSLPTPSQAPLNELEEHEPRRRRNILIGTFTILAALASFYFWPSYSSKKPVEPEKNFSEVSAPPRSRTKLVLPDSSVVWLNAGSKLTYNERFGVNNRNTTLVGEAFFDVKKSSIPFIIHANAVQIKVLGTAFNVRSYPDEKNTETALIRGRVEITLDKRPGEKFILKPNEKLIVANDTKQQTNSNRDEQGSIVELRGLTLRPDSTITETSWVNNKLAFQNESFSELAKKMEKWFGVMIEFKSEIIANERLSGTFTTETIQEALEELRMTTRFHFTIKENHILITP